jgi:hypothetical protein
MKFRIREGFRLFRPGDDPILYDTMGAKSGIVPRAVGGDEINLSQSEVQKFREADALGKLEPLDQEAIVAFGTTTPIIARIVTHPQEYAPPGEASKNVTETIVRQPVYQTAVYRS